MWAPKLDMTEALKRELDQFVDCIEQSSRPITDGQAGLRVVRILESASRSLAQRGRIIELEEARRIAWTGLSRHFAPPLRKRPSERLPCNLPGMLLSPEQSA